MNHHCRIGAITFRWDKKPDGMALMQFGYTPQGILYWEYWQAVSLTSDGLYVRYERTPIRPKGIISLCDSAFRASRQRSKASRKPKRVTGK